MSKLDATVIVGLIILAVWVAVAFVALHFIIKFW